MAMIKKRRKSPRKRKPISRAYASMSSPVALRFNTDGTPIEHVEPSFLEIRVQTSGTYRTERLGGNEYVVVPVVALVEGVLQGVTAQKPELALAEEFGRFPIAWNGRPITIDHPWVEVQSQSDQSQTEIIRVSASTSPEILEDFQVGFIFNTKLNGTKLEMEAWIDPVKVNEHSDEARQLLAKIKRGEKIEVSTGLFTSIELETGSYNSRDYSSVWRGVVPDHLALLPEGLVGACSNADGCGVYANAADPNPDVSAPVSGVETASGGTSVMNVQRLNSASCGCGSASRPTGPGVTTSQRDPNSPEPNAALSLSLSFNAQAFIANLMPDGMMDSDVRSILQGCLDDCYPGAYCYLIGFTNTSAIFSMYDSIDGDRDTYQCSYTIDSTTKACTFADDCIEVVLTTTVTPAPEVPDDSSMAMNSSASASASATEPQLPTGHSQENPTMTTANATPGTPAVTTPAATTTPPVATTATTAPPTASVEPIVSANTTASAAPTPTPSAPVTPKVLTVDEYLAAAPPGVREVMEQSLRMHSNRKAELVAALKGNARNKFSDEQLNRMDLQMLEQVAALATPVADYSGQGASPDAMRHQAAPQVNDGDSTYAPPPPRLGLATNAGGGNRSAMNQTPNNVNQAA